jgi:hypothetical protein
MLQEPENKSLISYISMVFCLDALGVLFIALVRSQVE